MDSGEIRKNVNSMARISLALNGTWCSVSPLINKQLNEKKNVRLVELILSLSLVYAISST